MKLSRNVHIFAPLVLVVMFTYVSLAWNKVIETHFFVPLGLFIFFAFVVNTWMNKKIVGQPSRTTRFLLQYIFTSVIAVLFAWATGTLTWDNRLPVVFAIGIFQAFGTYFKWKANDLSLAQTSLFTYWDDLIPMALSALLLKELDVFTPVMWAGVATCIGVTLYFIRGNWSDAKDKEGAKYLAAAERKRLAFYIAFYSVIWGVAMFLEKYFSFSQLSPGHFALGWYGGSLVTANLIYFFYDDPAASQKKTKVPLSAHDVVFMFYIACIISLCLMLHYVVLHTTPQNLSQPILMVSEAVFGTWIGLKVFGEGRQFSRGESIAMYIGLIGVALIGLGTFLKG